MPYEGSPYPWNDASLKITLRRAHAVAACGGLGNESKMPGRTWGISAHDCLVGSRLRPIAGSTCASCYALKGNYVWGDVQAAANRRHDAWRTDPDAWRDAIAFLIASDPLMRREPYFRWFPQGDLQSEAMLSDIAEVCRMLPHINFWLPTREHRMVRSWMRTNTLPPNLTVRLSALMIDGPAPDTDMPTSGVKSHKADASCPAQYQNNECGTCRSCWDRTVPHVDYPQH